ncbi:MAG: glycoside hydrolase family 105 protein [Opitutales bacterium]
MRPVFPRLLLTCAALALAGQAEGAEPVVVLLERVADWQLAHPSPKWKATDWHNAAFYTGVMALTEVSASPRYRAAMLRMGEDNGWQLGARPYHADDHAVGQTYADLCRLTGDSRMIAPLRERFDFILAHPKDDNLLADPARNPDYLDRWSWCDALFMAPPAWARLAQVTGDSRYLDYAITKWWVTSDYLYDRTEHLFLRDSRAFALREKNGRRVCWARGNGWVLAGLVRMLQAMPADHPARARFLGQFREMADRIAGLQSADGFWRASLLDPERYPMPESSGTGFFCYALAWGVNEGVLDRARYAPVVQKAWTALLSCVEQDGRLTHVQPVGFTPGTFDKNATEPYGVGAFLLAGREMVRFAAPGKST